jgi:hypothetical protein
MIHEALKMVDRLMLRVRGTGKNIVICEVYPALFN